MTPQIMLAVPNTSVCGQMNPSFCVAHVWNIRENPSLHAKLDRPGDYRGDDLTLV